LVWESTEGSEGNHPSPDEEELIRKFEEVTYRDGEQLSAMGNSTFV
jgi:hypothetical protein